jgi:hypothetical protein
MHAPPRRASAPDLASSRDGGRRQAGADAPKRPAWTRTPATGPGNQARLRRHASRDAGDGRDPVSRLAGRPLDPAVRRRMQESLGADFSAVRIHDDAPTRARVDASGARAITVGAHIAVGAEAMALHAGADAELLAHELAHVVQQTQRGVGGSAGALHEEEARTAAAAVGRGERAQVRLSAARGVQADLLPAGTARPSRPTNEDNELFVRILHAWPLADSHAQPLQFALVLANNADQWDPVLKRYGYRGIDAWLSGSASEDKAADALRYFDQASTRWRQAGGAEYLARPAWGVGKDGAYEFGTPLANAAAAHARQVARDQGVLAAIAENPGGALGYAIAGDKGAIIGALAFNAVGLAGSALQQRAANRALASSPHDPLHGVEPLGPTPRTAHEPEPTPAGDRLKFSAAPPAQGWRAPVEAASPESPTSAPGAAIRNRYEHVIRGEAHERGIAVIHLDTSKMTDGEIAEAVAHFRDADFKAGMANGLTAPAQVSREVADRVAKLGRQSLGLGTGERAGHTPDVAGGGDPLGPITSLSAYANGAIGPQWRRYKPGFVFEGYSLVERQTGRILYPSLSLEHEPAPIHEF